MVYNYNFECGLVRQLAGLNINVPVPLQKVEIRSRIVDFVAEIQVVQDYLNMELEPIETKFMFPVEEEAAVTDFEAEIDGRIIKTVVKEKEEARQEYDQAVLQQRSAFLLEETKPDLFQIKVGMLKPGCKARITITYLSELPVEEKCVRLTVPTSITPKYIPPTDDSEEAKAVAKIKYSSESPAPLKISVEANMKGNIKSLRSPSHDLVLGQRSVSNRICTQTATLQSTVLEMKRDFILLVESENVHDPKVFMETNKILGTTAAMISLIPSFNLKEQKVELIFLVDRSGSMSGSNIQQAKLALDLFLHSLPCECLFNIYSFGSHFSSLFETSVEYTDDTLACAKQHTAEMEANFGGTEIYNPLQEIFKVPPKEGYMRQVFVLTDGAVSNDKQVIQLVKKNRDQGRLFSLGLGNGCSRHLVKGIARAGNGTAVFASTQEDLRPKVMSQLKQALQPAINQIRLEWRGILKPETNPDLRVPNVEEEKTLLGYRKPKLDDIPISLSGQAPSKIQPIFDGSRLLAYRLFDSDEKPNGVTVIAQTPDGPLSVSLDISESDQLTGHFVHKLAARKKIQDLEESDSRNPEKVKKAIVTLGKTHSLASRHTSFVGVDPNKPDEIYHSMNTREIASQIPETFSFCASQSNSSQQMQMQPAAAMYCASAPLSQICSFGAGGVRRSSAPRGMFPQSPDCKFGALVAQQNTTGMFGPAGPARINASVPQSPGFMFGGCAPQRNEFTNEMDVGCKRDPADKETEINDTELIGRIVGLQGASGLFKWGPALERAFRLSHAEVEEKNPDKSTMSPDIWITFLVLAFLEVTRQKDKDLWELVAEKSRKFLMKKYGLEECEKSLNVAKQIIQF